VRNVLWNVSVMMAFRSTRTQSVKPGCWLCLSLSQMWGDSNFRAVGF